MKKRSMFKRLLSMLLAVVLMCGGVPAMAVDDEVYPETWITEDAGENGFFVIDPDTGEETVEYHPEYKDQIPVPPVEYEYEYDADFFKI